MMTNAKELLRLVLSLTVIAAVMGAMLAWVHSATAEPIAQAEAQAKIDALAQVLPAFDNDPSATSSAITVDGDSRPVTVYTATLDGQPAGWAVETWTADGFSGEITMMVGFDINGAVTGYQILSHAETPGLGAKAQEWFCDPRGHRSIIGRVGQLSVVQDGGTVDGITAATITSRAFLGAVNRAHSAINKLKQ